MSRSLTYSGTGTLRTWSEPNSLRETILNDLRSRGWGVSDLQISNAQSTNQQLLSAAVLPIGALIPTWNYNIAITYDNADEDGNVEALRQSTIENLSVWFSDVNLKLKYDSANPFGAFLRNYGLYLALGLGGLVVVKSLMRPAREYAPVAGRYARQYGKYLLV